VLEQFIQNANEAGFSVKGITFSPIKGPEGNIEFLAYLTSSEKGLNELLNCDEIVRSAHEDLKG
jgi:23S rRNA (cytidine1920-2'-O)/16S rRNA (cytidine1409-2'-O)-methyltransferase